MTHRPYLQRAAHVLGTVAIAIGILAAAPMAEALWSFGSPRTDRPSSAPLARLPEGDLVARMAIPRLGLDAPVYEGVAPADLARGAGHLPGTAFPGEEGGTNHCVVAIARDNSAAAISEAIVGEIVTMRTPFGMRYYRVAQKRVLSPEAVATGATRMPMVTIVTPYPADSIGPAPLRLALTLERVERQR
jgi:sortase A